MLQEPRRAALLSIGSAVFTFKPLDQTHPSLLLLLLLLLESETSSKSDVEVDEEERGLDAICLLAIHFRYQPGYSVNLNIRIMDVFLLKKPGLTRTAGSMSHWLGTLVPVPTCNLPLTNTKTEAELQAEDDLRIDLGSSRQSDSKRVPKGSARDMPQRRRLVERCSCSRDASDENNHQAYRRNEISIQPRRVKSTRVSRASPIGNVDRRVRSPRRWCSNLLGVNRLEGVSKEAVLELGRGKQTQSHRR